jgi:hypothetical protein
MSRKELEEQPNLYRRSEVVLLDAKSPLRSSSRFDSPAEVTLAAFRTAARKQSIQTLAPI